MSQRVFVRDVRRAAKSLGMKIAGGCYFSSYGECCPLAALTYEGVRRKPENVDDDLARRRIDKKFGKAYSDGFINAFDGFKVNNYSYLGLAAKLWDQGKKDGQKLRAAFIK